MQVLVILATLTRTQAQTAAPRSQVGSSAQTTAASAPENPAPKNTEDPEEKYRLQPGEDPQNRLVSPFIKHLVIDQEQFWTAPLRFQPKDFKWIAPFTGATAAFIATDSWMTKQVPDKPDQLTRSRHISDYAVYSMIGVGGGAFLLGHVTNNDHLAETGLLSGEAAINSTAVTYLFKEITQRQRPLDGNGHGDFFHGGASFPSEHSAIAWSIASVWAHEYPGTLSQIAAYGMASAVTISRVTAKQHFPADVVIGSALGWYFGRRVYRAHHDPELGGSAWGDIFDEGTSEKQRNPDYMGSPYVPLDSWVYPALERLVALGYLRSNVIGMRPWTRMACARLLDEAKDKFPNNDIEDGPAGKVYTALTDEFGRETARLDGAANVGARVDSLYTRSMGISGTPLRDGDHFGQTIINDYGRPYGEGYNNITGLTADAQAGPISINFRGEFQYAPAMPSYSSPILAATAAADHTPPLANGTAEFNRFQLLDSTASINIDNLQISFGNQSVWLGPGESGPLLMSNNAAPFPMVKFDDVAPHEIPGLSRLLGPFRAEFFVGQLSGQHWEECALSTCKTYPGYPDVVGPNISPQPFIHGEKISFQPTPNLEFGMGVTAMFGGPGLPLTLGNFFRTYYVHTDPAHNPGKRVSAADISYRIPGLRNWLTFYLDSMTWDEVSPIGSTRANINPGIYMPKIPKLPNLQLRAEGFNISRTNEFNIPGWVYYNIDRYRSGYTNDGNLLASWIGRAGRGGQGWLTYWFSARNKLQFGYRLQTVAPNFIGGGRLADYSAQTEFRLGSNLSVSAFVQYEQWRFPVLDPNSQSNVTASVQLTIWPRWQIQK